MKKLLAVFFTFMAFSVSTFYVDDANGEQCGIINDGDSVHVVPCDDQVANCTGDGTCGIVIENDSVYLLHNGEKEFMEAYTQLSENPNFNYRYTLSALREEKDGGMYVVKRTHWGWNSGEIEYFFGSYGKYGLNFQRIFEENEPALIHYCNIQEFDIRIMDHSALIIYAKSCAGPDQIKEDKDLHIILWNPRHGYRISYQMYIGGLGITDVDVQRYNFNLSVTLIGNEERRILFGF